MAPASLRIPALVLIFCASIASAAPRALDQGRIHAEYNNGDFEKVIRDLEAFLKSGRRCAHAESLFLEKHLGVVYAANPGTRELGRYHMFRMLDLSPGSDLLDMFVGEEVDGVFEKVRKEHSLRAAVRKTAPPVKAPAAISKKTVGKPSAVPAKASWDSFQPVSAPAKPTWDTFPSASDSLAAGNARKAATPRPELPSKKPASAWKEPGLWIGGGAALAMVAVALFYSTSSDAPEPVTYAVPATVAR